MIKIYIFADSFKHFENGIKEYEKRLGRDLKIIKLKPSKKKEDSQIVKEETEIILNKILQEKGYKIVLSPRGKILDTDELVQLVQAGKMKFGNIIFIIGGAFGFDYDKLKGSIDLELALGKMTMPHALAMQVLLEQVYRVGMIEKGTSYHK